MPDGRLKPAPGPCPQCGKGGAMLALKGREVTLACQHRDCRHRVVLGDLDERQVQAWAS